MSGEYLLDTNLVIALLEREAGVLARFEKEGAVSISVVTCGELGYGARKSSRVEKNLARIEAFADDCTVLACD